MDAEVVRFGSEPIEGWRAWRVRYVECSPSDLQSIAHGLAWPARRPMPSESPLDQRIIGRVAL